MPQWSNVWPPALPWPHQQVVRVADAVEGWSEIKPATKVSMQLLLDAAYAYVAAHPVQSQLLSSKRP